MKPSAIVSRSRHRASVPWAHGVASSIVVSRASSVVARRIRKPCKIAWPVAGDAREWGRVDGWGLGAHGEYHVARVLPCRRARRCETSSRGRALRMSRLARVIETSRAIVSRSWGRGALRTSTGNAGGVSSSSRVIRSRSSRAARPSFRFFKQRGKKPIHGPQPGASLRERRSSTSLSLSLGSLVTGTPAYPISYPIIPDFPARSKAAAARRDSSMTKTS